MNIWKRYFPLTFALIFATLSSVSVYYFLRDRGGISHAASSSEGVLVIVAKSTIPLGKKIAESDLRAVPWPRDTVPEESFQTIQPLVGRIAKNNIVANEPVLSNKLMAEGENFSSLIPSDMRGVTVSVKRSQALADILVRGTTVDVISMYENEVGPPTTKVIAQNVKVLAVHKGGPEVNGGGDEPKDMEVTLIVTPREAEWLVTAMNKGVIQLAVRNAHSEPLRPVNRIG